MDNRIIRTVLFAAFAFLHMSASGAGAARFGTLRNTDWVVTNAWQAVSNKTHDLILEIGHGDSLPPDWQNVSNAAMNAVQSLQPAYDYTDNAITSFSSTGSVFRSFSYGTSSYWTDATGCVWKVISVPSGPWTATTNVITDVSMSPEDDLITYVPLTFRYLGRDCWSNVQPSEVADLTEFTVPTQGKNWDWYYLTDDEDQTQVYDSFPITFVRGTTVITNLVGRVALTNDISQFMSTNNSEFVSAVLSVPIAGASQSDLSEIAEYGTYGTVGAAILALIAGLAALKRGKLDGSTAYPAWDDDSFQGEWPAGTVVSWNGKLYRTASGTIDTTARPDSYAGSFYWDEVTIGTLLATKQNALTFDDAPTQSSSNPVKSGGVYTALQGKANAANLPYDMVTPVNGQLLDRAVNAVSVSTDTTLTLPALVNAGKARDFLVRLEISGSTVPTITFAAPTGETIAYETAGDEFPVPDAEGAWLYSFTETAAGVFAVSLKQLQSVSQPTQTQGGS